MESWVIVLGTALAVTLVVAIFIFVRCRRLLAQMEPENSGPGRVVPDDVPIRKALRLEPQEESQEEPRGCGCVGYPAAVSPQTPSLHWMKDLLTATFNDMEKSRYDLEELPTRVANLDKVIGGLRPGELCVVGGRPSTGKSTLLHQIAENTAFDTNRCVLLCSPGITPTEVVLRMLCSRAGVDLRTVIRGRVVEEQFQQLVMAAGVLHDSRILFDDTADRTVRDVSEWIRRNMSDHQIDLVIVDDYNRLRAPVTELRGDEMASITADLKTMAVELEIPVLASIGLADVPDGRETNRPSFWDFRELGEFDNPIDVLLLMHRPSFWRTDQHEDSPAEIVVSRNRGRPSQLVRMEHITRTRRYGLPS